MNKSMMWGVVVIALIVGLVGGYFFEKAKAQSQLMMMQESMQKQINDAKLQSEKVMQDNNMKQDDKMGTSDSMIKDGTDKMMPSGK